MSTKSGGAVSSGTVSGVTDRLNSKCSELEFCAGKVNVRIEDALRTMEAHIASFSSHGRNVFHTGGRTFKHRRTKFKLRTLRV